MKILLIQPELNPNTLTFKRLSLAEPLALEILASGLLDRHDVKILDMQIDGDLDHCLDSFRPDIVGATCIAYTEIPCIEDLMQRVKTLNRDIITVVGGHHPTLSPGDFNEKLIDFIVFSEGEETFKELVDAIQQNVDYDRIRGIGYWEEGRLKTTPPRPLMENLDTIPLPSRESVKRYSGEYFHLWYKPVDAISTSRGCPFRCNFCAVWKFYRGKCRFMGAERVVREIETTKAGNIFFWDDNFSTDVNRAIKIAECIKQKDIRKERYFFEGRSDTIANNPSLIEKWREAGELIVYVGFETINEKYLEKLHKRNKVKYNDMAIDILHQNDAAIFGSFIVDPGFSEEDFDELREYIIKKRIPLAKFLVLTPLPGTDLYKEKNHDIITHDYNMYDMSHAILPTKLKPEKFYEHLASLYTSLGEAFTSFGMKEFKKVKPDDKLLKNLKLSLKEMNNYHSFIPKQSAVS